MASPAVVLPVYDAAQALARCLASLVRWPQVPVILVDDASPDPAIGPMLDAFAASRAGTRVIRRAANGGFAAAANEGASAAPAGSDLLFLNADTEVTAGALDAMCAALAARDDAALACPLSNNATFLSVPRYQQESGLPPGVAAEDMAAILARLAAAPLEIPTAVGFCMLVRRRDWDAVGPFDSAYGRGYGEDDDLAQRLRSAARVLLGVPSAFVAHEGHASFGRSEETLARRRESWGVLQARWPQYAATVAAFARDNPLRPLHEAVWHRLLSWPQERPLHVIHVVPAWEDPWQGEVETMVAITRAVANHTVLVPTDLQGGWLDAIDGPVRPALRLVGIPESGMARFASASPARAVHFHGERWRDSAVPAAVRATGRRTLVTARASADVERCLALYGRAA